MLTSLSLRNLALVEQLELEFGKGLTIISGETGAGKSITLDALSLVLGERASHSVIKSGAPKAEICATFDLDQSGNYPRQWLVENDLALNDECVLRRIIATNSRGYINGSAVSMQQMRELGQLLVDIHGQHQHQFLLRKPAHRVILDDYGQNQELSNQVAQNYQSWQASKKELTQLQQNLATRNKLKEELQFDIQELSELNLQQGEAEQLDQELHDLHNADKTIEIAQQALHLLQGSGDIASKSVLGDLSIIQKNLSTSKNSHQAQISNLVEEAYVPLNELSAKLSDQLQNLQTQPQRLTEVEERLAVIHSLTRKYRVPENTLWQQLGHKQKLLDELADGESNLQQLKKTTQELQQKFVVSANQLSSKRQQAAKRLSAEVTGKIKQLKISGQFAVACKQLANPNEQGNDDIEFLYSAHQHLDLQPLRAIASGGELSRISLAICVCIAQKSVIPSLILDEVDVGISGVMAAVVGKMLKDLSQHTQIVCVTHQPQVAAFGDEHYLISKDTSAKVSLKKLTTEQRVQELSRMLGGTTISPQTIAHATDMLQQAQNAK